MELQDSYHNAPYTFYCSGGKDKKTAFLSQRKEFYNAYSNLIYIYKGEDEGTIYIDKLITDEELAEIVEFLTQFEIKDERVDMLLTTRNPIKETIVESHLARVCVSYSFNQRDFEYFYGARIPVIQDASELKKFDVVVTLGGEDVSPSLYHAKNEYSSCNLERDLVEVPIIESAISKRKKIFGVCRGHQLVNALTGGDLTQDIFLDGYPMHPSYHELNFVGNRGNLSKFFKGKKIASTHHQGVIKSSVMATSTYQGIIESVENNSIITMQSHPEYDSSNKEFFTWLFNIWPWM
jgi:putative glutamine amidotransferase